MSATTRSSSPSLASLSETSDSDTDNLSSTNALSAQRDDAMDDATANGKHGSRFFEGEGLVTLLVEGVSYRVHEYLLTMHSPYWARELGEKKKSGCEIETKNVAVHDMDALMKILYHKSFQGYDLASFEEWQSALRLATKWECTSICRLAIEKLEPLASPLQKLVMARTFGVADWLQPALTALCVREDPLTLAEGEQLSMRDVIAINATREATRPKTQTIADASQVSAYISQHIQSTGIMLPASSNSVLPELAQAAGPTPSSPPSVTPTPLLPVHPASAPANLPTSLKIPVLPAPPSVGSLIPVLPALPSVGSLDHVVTALQKSDFDLAISLVTSENVKAFVDALDDHTHICMKPSLSESFVDAILRRGAKEDSFVAIGIQLICALPKSMIFDETYGWQSCYAFLNERAKISMKAHRGVMSSRSNFNTVSFVSNSPYAHSEYLLKQKDEFNAQYHIYLEMLGGESLTTSLYDERSANLQSLYKGLVEAKMLNSSALN